MKVDYKKQIIEELKDIPEEDLSKIYELIHWIKFKIVNPEKEETIVSIVNHDEDPLEEVIGCCEGQGDMSDKHDLYLYGKGKNDLH